MIGSRIKSTASGLDKPFKVEAASTIRISNESNFYQLYSNTTSAVTISGIYPSDSKDGRVITFLGALDSEASPGAVSFNDGAATSTTDGIDAGSTGAFQIDEGDAAQFVYDKNNRIWSRLTSANNG